MIEILTNRLMIIPCSLDIAKSLVFHRNELDKQSPIEFPICWPSAFVKGFLPLYIENLESKEKKNDCGLWLIILYEEKRIIGDILMQGKPSKEGMVELCYHVDEKQVDETIAFEAVDAFIDWLTYQKFVTKVVMECEVEQERSIRLFEKLGMLCTEKEGRFLMWEIQKKDFE